MILLDDEYTADIFGEYKYQTNIKTSPTTLKIMTNGGLLTNNQQGNLNNDGNEWYYTQSIRNIISISNVNKKNHIIYDYENGDRFIVINTIPGGQDMIFTVNKGRFYYNDMRNTKGVSMLSTVEENRKHYTQACKDSKRK